MTKQIIEWIYTVFSSRTCSFIPPLLRFSSQNIGRHFSKFLILHICANSRRICGKNYVDFRRSSVGFKQSLLSTEQPPYEDTRKCDSWQHNSPPRQKKAIQVFGFLQVGHPTSPQNKNVTRPKTVRKEKGRISRHLWSARPRPAKTKDQIQLLKKEHASLSNRNV